MLAFVRFWTRQTGHPPPHLVFDSQCTTYRNLGALQALGVHFITLRRRSPALLREMALQPRSAWRTVHLDVPQRQYQTLTAAPFARSPLPNWATRSRPSS